MSTQISTQAQATREQARSPDGKFGVQPAAEATTRLTPPGNDQTVMAGALADLGVDPSCIHTEEHGVSIQPNTDTGMAIYVERDDEGYTVTEKAWGGQGPDSYDEEDELYRGENLDAALDAAWTRTDEAVDHGWPVLAKQETADPAPAPVWGISSQADRGNYDPAPF